MTSSSTSPPTAGSRPASPSTLATKNYPGEPDTGLDRPGSFGVNIAQGRRGGSGAPGADAHPDPSTLDQVMPHLVYAELGWVAVVDPGERTRAQVLALLAAPPRQRPPLRLRTP